MSNLTQLRIAAREIFDETLRAVDAGAAVHRAIRQEGSRVEVCDTAIDLGNRSVFSVAIGKAALPMAYALEQQLGDSLKGGVISGPLLPGLRDLSDWKLRNRWRYFDGGHPLPNPASLQAATEVFALLQRASNEKALVIFLISGGGSAMLEWPINQEITLADLRSANSALVSCGASIGEVNAVRRAFSAVKGGRLAGRAGACDQITLIISDVPRGDERNVASGPTLAPPVDAPNALDVLDRYDLRGKVPETILRAVADDSGDAASDSTALRQHFVLLDNQSALEAAAAAARGRGFTTEVAQDISDQPIAAGCSQLVSRLRATNSGANTVCLISGGEFACKVRGDGLGGRNQETALRLAREQNLPKTFVALCAGTDGIDGNSPAAGAIVDQTTDERARAIGLNASDSIDRSDAYSFFVALGDAIATGATGTNVRDIRILIASRD